MVTKEMPSTPAGGPATLGIWGLAFIKGLLGYVAAVVAFWGYDTYVKPRFPSSGEHSPNIPMSPDHYGIILVFLAAVGVLIASAYAFGEVGAIRAEKKGYEQHFGFLLFFYFSAFGAWVLNRLAPNTAALERRYWAAEEKEAGKDTSAPELTWNLVYPRLRPNFRGLIVLLAVSVGLTWMLQLRGEDLGGRSASMKDIPLFKAGWLCVQEQTFTADKNTLYRMLVTKNGRPMADSLGLPMYQEKEVEGIQSEQMKSIGADDYILRDYTNIKTGESVQLYIVYRRYGRREFNHNPDMCFPAGGYEQKQRDIAQLPYAGKMVPVVHIIFDGSHVQLQDGSGKAGRPYTTVSYFFASGKKTESNFMKQQMWMALERLMPNKNGWALIRLNTDHVRPLGGGKSEPISANEALAAQQDFMQAFGGAVEKSITTDETSDAVQFNPDGTAAIPAS